MSMNNLKLMLWQQHYALIIVLYLSQEKIKSKNWEGGGVEHAVPPAPHSLYSLPPSRLPPS